MSKQTGKNLLCLLPILVWTLVNTICIGAQPAPIEPQPLYDQCESLVVGTEREDETARAITSLKDQDPKVRAESVQKLSKSCDKRAVEAITGLLRDQELPVRLAAIESLGKLGDPDSVTWLNEIIDDPDWHIRLALVRTLASFKTFKARNLVVNGIANPNGMEISDLDDMRVRCIAILTANQLKDVQHSRKSVLFLHVFMASRHEPIRRLAEQTMYVLKNTRNGPAELMAILKQSNIAELRRWSAYWIGKLGIESARGILTEVAALDTNVKVKEAATEALKALNAAKGT